MNAPEDEEEGLSEGQLFAGGFRIELATREGQIGLYVPLAFDMIEDKPVLLGFAEHRLPEIIANWLRKHA